MYGFEDYNEDNFKIIDNIINYLFELWYIYFFYLFYRGMSNDILCLNIFFNEFKLDFNMVCKMFFDLIFW